jgi:hypothetical protein
MRFLLTILLLLIAILSCGCPRPQKPNTADQPDISKLNDPLDLLLKRYVKDGRVDYVAWKSNEADVQSLETYLNSLADIRADNIESYGDRKAFWTNAYNAFGIKLVIEHYPIKSVLFDVKTNNDPAIKDFFDVPERKIGTVVVSLDDIEQARADTRTNPMLHFVMSKPALGSPDLQPFALRGKNLEEQIDQAARAFLRDPTKGLRVEVPEKKVYLSSIFKQYRLEFGGDLLEFVRPFITAEQQAKIDSINKNQIDFDYLPFDWVLNDVVKGKPTR